MAIKIPDYTQGAPIHRSPGTLNISTIFGMILLVILVGAIGFMIIEKWPFLDALYMTIITLSTVGFREIEPLSGAGQVWTIFLIIFGIGVLGYTGVSKLSQYVINFQFLRTQRTLRKIRTMKNHYIICGFGRMGRVIADEFAHRKQQFVVIEQNPEIVATLAELDYQYIEGSAVEDDTLKNAGLENARGLISVLSTDAENLFVALTARTINKEIIIVTRCSEPSTVNKMKAAGANKVINPYEIGGHKMAQMMLSPHVDDFIEIVSRRGTLDLAIDQIQVFEGSAIAGKPLKDSLIRSEYNTIVTAILDSNNKMHFNPSSESMIHPGDTLICIGDRENLEQLDQVARDTSDYT